MNSKSVNLVKRMNEQGRVGVEPLTTDELATYSKEDILLSIKILKVLIKKSRDEMNHRRNKYRSNLVKLAQVIENDDINILVKNK